MNQKMKISRREFIKITAIAGGVLAAGKFLADYTSKRLASIQETRFMMGTIINLSVIGLSKADAEQAVAATFTELERHIGIFDHRAAGSPVAAFNRDGVLPSPPAELVAVLEQALDIGELTGGAFDITVKPLVDLYQKNQPELPSEDAIAAALDLVGYQKLSVSSELVRFTRPAMAVTLDGIAKGYIVDAGVGILRRMGYENTFVEAGGDLMASGSKEDETPWRVGVRSPRDEGPQLLASFDVRNQAVATSGDYMNFFSPDLANHHILDPRTGISPAELASATVMAPSAVLADSLATAAMVLGLGGLELIEGLASCEGIFVTKEMAVYKTSGIS